MNKSIATRFTSLFLLAVTMLLVGCATQTPEEKALNNIGKGDAKMEKALESLNSSDTDYMTSDTKGATKSFNKAVGYINDAVVYYAKAATTPDQKGAVDDVKSGLADMKKCVEALEDNDTDKAQDYYNSAQTKFDAASSELWGAT